MVALARSILWGIALALVPVMLLRAQTMPEHIGSDQEAEQMIFNASGLVMNANSAVLPRDCQAVTEQHEFTVKVGVEYAQPYPGTIFGMSLHEYRVEPCSLVTITLVNEDQIRHQWMLHGLPRYLYPQGMFHLEAAGGATQTGSFIVPADNMTYLVHCDMTQHMEKGMKAQLVAGRGSGDLWSIPGISQDLRQQSSGTAYGLILAGSMAIMSFLVMTFLGKGTNQD